MRIGCVNQDPGIAPGRAKGAAVHLAAIRAALTARGEEVVEIDEEDAAAVWEQLTTADAEDGQIFVARIRGLYSPCYLHWLLL